MSATGATLSHIAPVLRVRDLTRSLEFYRESLGFELEFCYEDFYAAVCRDGCHIHLNCAAPTPRDQAAFERDQHIDACLIVHGIDALAQSFSAAAVPFSQPLRNMPYGREFYVRDPDAYILGFIEPQD